jgi:hypothetical protein
MYMCIVVNTQHDYLLNFVTEVFVISSVLTNNICSNSALRLNTTTCLHVLTNLYMQKLSFRSTLCKHGVEKLSLNEPTNKPWSFLTRPPCNRKFVDLGHSLSNQQRTQPYDSLRIECCFVKL